MGDLKSIMLTFGSPSKVISKRDKKEIDEIVVFSL